MRHALMTLSLLLMAQGSALADDGGMPDVGPPPETDTSCVMQKLPECQQALSSCEQDQTALLDYVRQQCPMFKDKTNDQILHDAKTPKPPPPPPVVHHRDPGKSKDDGDKDKGRKPKVVPPAPKTATVIRMERFKAHDGCPAGGLLLSTAVGDKVTDSKVLCDGKDGAPGKTGPQGPQGPQGLPGKDGSSGRPGKNGDTRVQFGLGMRTSVIHSSGRPNGYSAAPEAQLELWLAPTVEFVGGVAWAPDGDRNMVVTSQLRYRALNNRVGIGVGLQYQAWNLEGNKALWQSVMGLASVQFVLVDVKHFNVSADAGLLLGLDGYDQEAQFAEGATAGLTATATF